MCEQSPPPSILGVVTTLPQRLLFTSVVHVACYDMHNGSSVAPVLRCSGGSNFLLRRWKFNLQSLFTWCLCGFTLKCLFSLVLPIPTSFSQAVTPAQLPHFTASNKPSFDVGLPNPTLSKRGVIPLPPQHLPIGSFFHSSILDYWRKLASRKCRDNPYWLTFAEKHLEH